MDDESKGVKSDDNGSSGLNSSLMDNQAPNLDVQPQSGPTPSDPTVTSPIMSSQAGPKRNTKMLVIAAIVLLIVVGGALAYASTRSANKDSTIKTPAKPAAATQANTTDVDETSQEVDNNLNTVNDDEDFNSTDLSDSSLDM